MSGLPFPLAPLQPVVGVVVTFAAASATTIAFFHLVSHVSRLSQLGGSLVGGLNGARNAACNIGLVQNVDPIDGRARWGANVVLELAWVLARLDLSLGSALQCLGGEAQRHGTRQAHLEGSIR